MIFTMLGSLIVAGRRTDLLSRNGCNMKMQPGIAVTKFSEASDGIFLPGHAPPNTGTQWHIGGLGTWDVPCVTSGTGARPLLSHPQAKVQYLTTRSSMA